MLSDHRTNVPCILNSYNIRLYEIVVYKVGNWNCKSENLLIKLNSQIIN